VDRRHLDHRAARGHKPAKARAIAQLADGAGGRPAVTDERDHRQILTDDVQVGAGIQREDGRRIQFDPCIEKPQVRAGENTPALMRSPRSTRGTTRTIA
jgi:hypothetical protein